MADDSGKTALIAQLAEYRARLSQHAESVQESVDVGARVQAGFAKNRAAWLGGAALVGVVLTRLRPRRTVKIKGEHATARAAVGVGILLPVLKLAFDLARPTLVSLLTARIADFAASREPRRPGRPR